MQQLLKKLSFTKYVFQNHTRKQRKVPAPAGTAPAHKNIEEEPIGTRCDSSNQILRIAAVQISFLLYEL